MALTAAVSVIHSAASLVSKAFLSASVPNPSNTCHAVVGVPFIVILTFLVVVTLGSAAAGAGGVALGSHLHKNLKNAA